jgi:hypothetical protein
MKAKSGALAPLANARLNVACVLVEPMRVWFHCPHCDEALTGFFGDPRGQTNVRCQACGEDFDISPTANLVIV